MRKPKGAALLAEIPRPTDPDMAVFYGGRPELSGRPDNRPELSGRPDNSKPDPGRTDAVPMWSDLSGRPDIPTCALAVDRVVPDPNQPREVFDQAKLDELGQSFRACGQLQPVLVRPEGDTFILIAGERRWRAAKLIGWPTLDAKILNVDAATAFEIAVAENVQRESLLPLEEAKAYQRLLGEHSSQADVARRLGVDRRRISEKLALLRLPVDVRALLSAHHDTFTESHALLLVGLPEKIGVVKLARRCAEEGWSSRRLKHAIARGTSEPTEPGLFENVRMAINQRGGFTLTVRARSKGEVQKTIEELENLLGKLRASFEVSGRPDNEDVQEEEVQA